MRIRNKNVFLMSNRPRFMFWLCSIITVTTGRLLSPPEPNLATCKREVKNNNGLASCGLIRLP